MAALASRRVGSIRIAAAIVVALAATLASRPVSAAGVRLQVQAGVGGVARSSRWTPVRITIENPGPDLSGELLIEWGDARLHREVTLASPSRVLVEAYLRSADVRSRLTVRLIAGGGIAATVQAPVRIIGDNETLNVCVVPSGVSPAGAECTATVAPDALPRSARGYDAVDHLTFLGASSSLARDQRAAVDRWRAFHALEIDDLLARAPRAPSRAVDADAPRPVTSVAITASIYLIALLTACGVWLRRPRATAKAYGAMVLAVVVASVVTVWAGRVGPGATIVLRHATTVQQVADGSLVVLRGTVEYPDFNHYELRSSVLDGALTDRLASTPEQWVDDSGFPVRRGTFGRAARNEVEFEGVLGYAPFSVVTEGDIVRVTNVSDRTLSDCRFPDGFTRAGVGDLPPGAAVDARELAHPDAPFFACQANRSPVSFTDPRFPVRSDGITVVSVRLPGPGGVGGVL